MVVRQAWSVVPLAAPTNLPAKFVFDLAIYFNPHKNLQRIINMFQHNPPHPGSFIKPVYLDPQSLGIHEVASKLHVSRSTFGRLVNGKLRVSTVMALKLSKVLGRSPES